MWSPHLLKPPFSRKSRPALWITSCLGHTSVTLAICNCSFQTFQRTCYSFVQTKPRKIGTLGTVTRSRKKGLRDISSSHFHQHQTSFPIRQHILPTFSFGYHLDRHVFSIRSTRRSFAQYHSMRLRNKWQKYDMERLHFLCEPTRSIQLPKPSTRQQAISEIGG